MLGTLARLAASDKGSALGLVILCYPEPAVEAMTAEECLLPHEFNIFFAPSPRGGSNSVAMSALRHRFLGPSGDSTPESSEVSRDPSPAKSEPVTLISDAQLKKLKSKKSKRRQGLIFGLGGLFGLFVAAFFANQHDVINLEGLVDFNLEALIDVIPAGIVNDAKDITACLVHSRPFNTRSSRDR